MVRERATEFVEVPPPTLGFDTHTVIPVFQLHPRRLQQSARRARKSPSAARGRRKAAHRVLLCRM